MTGIGNRAKGKAVRYGRTAGQVPDPGTMVTPTGLDALRPVADEATRRLDAAPAPLVTPASGA